MLSKIVFISLALSSVQAVSVDTKWKDIEF